MANTDVAAPIVVAIIGLLGSFLSVFLSWHSLKLARKETVSDLTKKYGQPLIVAAYDLQQRLFELVEYPISRQHLKTSEGVDDLKIFTCYLLAQYLVAVYIIRTKTAYLSFSKDSKVKEMRKIMYLIDEELDRRRERDADSRNIGVWPAARILISERMILKDKGVNSALDGGYGFDVKGFDQFRREWDENFKEPMGYFCETIDMMLEGRMGGDVAWSDCALRVLQHLLVDLIKRLDTKQAYVIDDPEDMKCEKSSRGCDCDHCDHGITADSTLKERQDSRWGDPGLWTEWGLRRAKNKYKPYNPASDPEYTLEEVKKKTHYIDLD